MNLCLNKPTEFGYEFLFLYEQSLNDFWKKLLIAKNKVLHNLKNDNALSKVRDIEAGFSFFVKYQRDILNNKELPTTLGKYYGQGLEDYLNIHLDSSLL